jgi:hypothetical protein
VRKTAKLAVVLVFTITLAGPIFSTILAEARQGKAGAVDPVALQNRLGGDDGFALAVDFSGDYQGSLETCG